jgi:hypothetical protein
MVEYSYFHDNALYVVLPLIEANRRTVQRLQNKLSRRFCVTSVIYLQFIAILSIFFGEQDATDTRFSPQNITVTSKLKICYSGNYFS